MKKGSAHEYEGLNIHDRKGTVNATGVYTIIQRNSNKTGKQITYITPLTLRVTGCSSFEKETYMGLQKFIYTFDMHRHHDLFDDAKIIFVPLKGTKLIFLALCKY